ncbi:MAG: nucleotidyltransferase domain-containing protein [Anaerolineae bacterium]|nr:MAG: nucleotidyltransferase domain-containing protein [Anaerolineae bacterium]
MVHYPGTSQHKALLHAVVDHYNDDPRVLAIVVFGSLGRGTWDKYSDIDLDIILTDETQLDPVHEFQRLCDSFLRLGERAALIIPDGDDAGDLVLESLVQLSIRYHPLADTSPNIVDGLHLLSGRLTAATIVAAGVANQRYTHPPLAQLVDQCIRYAAVVQTCILRERHWLTIELLHRMRSILMEIFSRTHGGLRAHQMFEHEADPRVQVRLGATLPQYDLSSLRQALELLLMLLEDDLESLSNGQLALTRSHQEVIRQIRQRGLTRTLVG